MVPCTLDELKRHLGIGGNSCPHLEEALTHRTYAVENALSYDNQRLEFLGDAVLEIILSDYLFARFPNPEGDLTKMRSALACESTLAEFARKLELGVLLRIGKGEKLRGGAARCSTLADLFEAVLGAVYLDCGMEAAGKLVLSLLEAQEADPARLLYEINPKGRLQEFTQERWNVTPKYSVLSVSGPSHDPEYLVEASLRRWTAVASGKNHKAGECAAAARLLRYLQTAEEGRKK